MKNDSRLILFILIALSVCVGLYEAYLYYINMEASKEMLSVWGVVFIVFLVFWVHEDSKAHPNIYKPFDYGFLVFLFYVPYFPYYLVKTRGWVVGFCFLFGAIVLFNMGWFFQWIIYMSD